LLFLTVVLEEKNDRQQRGCWLEALSSEENGEMRRGRKRKEGTVKGKEAEKRELGTGNGGGVEIGKWGGGSKLMASSLLRVLRPKDNVPRKGAL
jgi:hypothetical protein